MQSGSMTLVNTRTEIANGANTLLVNADGSINIAVIDIVPISGTVAVSNFPAVQAVSGPLTDTQLRATPVPISGTVTANTGLAQPLTDTQLRATPVPISGTVGVSGSVAVTGTFWQTTQPISGSVSVSNFPATQVVSGSVNATLAAETTKVIGTVNIAAAQTIGVTGTFWQTTQPVSIAATVNTATTLAAETTKVIGTVNISAGQTIAVTGGLTDTQLRATPVPISGTVTANTGLSQPLTDTQLRATAVPVSAATLPLPTNAATSALQTTGNTSLTSIDNKLPAQGQALMAASQPVTLASDQTPITDGTVSGTLGANTTDTVEISCDGRGSAYLQLTNTWAGTVTFETTVDNWTTIQAITGVQAGSSAIQLNTTANGAWMFNVTGRQKIRVRKTAAGSGTVSAIWRTGKGVSVVNVYNGSAANMPITPPTLTKGTQGASGFSVQDLKDAGRNVSTLFMDIPIVTTNTDALQSLTGYKSGAAVGATTTPAVVTAAKSYRITQVQITYVAIATAGSVKFTLRANTGGVVALSSPAVITWVVGAPAATAGISQTATFEMPDGLEFAAGTGIGVSMVGLSATQVAAAVGYGKITIYGYEY